MQICYTNQQGESVMVNVTDQPIKIGRGSACEIVLEDEQVSRQHCQITRWDGEYILKDLKSQNGTRLNGQTVEEAVLRNGDLIMCGDSHLTVSLPKKSGANTIIRKLDAEMRDQHKGYETVMRQLVRDADRNLKKEKS